MDTKTIGHSEPAWGMKADFIIRARCSTQSIGESGFWEQLWSKRVSKNNFVICCIPFFVYNIALGDEVKTDDNYWITEIIHKSGHFTFRVCFGDGTDPTIRKDVINRVVDWGCSVENHSFNLLAIDVPTEISARLVADFLYHKEQQGLLVYETGQI